MHVIPMITDSYKTSQYKQYPAGTEYIYSYIESRGGSYDEVVMHGLQAFLKMTYVHPVTQDDVEYAASFYKEHGTPFNREGWEYIVNELEGKLPVKIDALPEGTVVGTKRVLATVVNTDPKCAWLTSYLETALLRAVWYPTTVATLSRECKKVIMTALEKTGTPEGIDFKLHDFGARGVSSQESAAIGGCAHLVNFKGSDTVEGVIWANELYDGGMVAYSIPASEHSTITSWEREGEIDAYVNMIEQFGGEGKMYACVSDSYDIWAALDMWKQLEPRIIAKGGTLVIRPDSGDPIHTPVNVVMKCLELFGYTTNDKGYKVLPDHIRVIQGDGVNLQSIEQILFLLDAGGVSADNIAFGMGGELLQKPDRDRLKFAMKCSAACVNGEWRDVYKDPITDSGKTSKRGLVYTDTIGAARVCKYHTQNFVSTALVTVFENGKLYNESTFEEIRERAAI